MVSSPTPTILLIDDSKEVLTLCSMLLKSAGYRVLTSSSVTCLDLIFGQQPQLILMDIQMPGIGGETAARILLKERRSIHGKIYFHSAEDEDSLSRRATEVGVDGFLRKGLPPPEFLMAIASLIPPPEEELAIPPPADGPRVLLVDESRAQLTIVTRLLHSAGFQVITAESGEDALRVAVAERPDAVLVEAKLPGISGATTIQRLRSYPTLRALPCILVTSVTGEQEEVLALDSGADAFWRKGEHPELLVARLHSMLRSRGEAPAAEASRWRILIADDSPTALEQAASLLEDAGNEVERASSGEEALAKVTAQSFDAVLLDMVMPGIGGREACRRMREIPALRDLPILVLTAQEDPHTLIEAIGAGADDAVRKTADCEVLQARVRSIVRRRHSELQARRLEEDRRRHESGTRQARATEELSETRAKLLADLEGKNRELEIARRRAEETSLHKSAFLANMSHEIRTPMNAVIGMTSLLMGTSLTAEQKEYVETIRGSGEHLMMLINDILDFSKVEAGEMVIEAYRFSIVTCVEEAMDLVRTPARDKGLELLFNPLGVVPGAVIGDAGRLRQILLNLLSNAIKFTEKGRVEIGLTVTPLPDRKIRASFTVKDTGIGMNEEVQARLFRPFVQGEISTTRNYGGTGLGLVISKRLAEMMGGGIQVTSAMGSGSTFHVDVTLEVADWAPQVTDVTKAPAEDLFDPGLARRFPLRILVAEDNAINQRVAEGMLSKLGYRADMVGNGLEAVEAVRRMHYDLILMDMRMPMMDGMAATRAIRELERDGPRPFIIALTASIIDIDSESIREIGLDDLVLKPVTPESLMKALGRMQAKLPARSAASTAQSDRPTPPATAPTGSAPASPGFGEEPDAVDLEAFEVLASLLGPAELDEILELYLTRTVEQFQHLSTAADRGDWAQVRALGHELTPVCASLGAKVLSGMTKELELIAAAGGGPECFPKVVAMSLEADRVREELERLRAGRKL